MNTNEIPTPRGAYRTETMNTLPNDIARCNGDWHEDGANSGWREGCETCLRRIAPRPEHVWMLSPPPIIAFECEYLIEPTP